jgi:beta-barrel assembly-enhancing protease
MIKTAPVRMLAFLLAGWAVPGAALAAEVKAKTVKLDGYAEWRQGEALVVDGQRVRFAANGELKGKDEASHFASIPLGWEVKVEGLRLIDGTVLARKVETKPNGSALFEGELKSAMDDMEQQYRRQRRVYDEDENGRITDDYGALYEDGPMVDRVRAITNRLVPGYLHPEEFRVYVVDNKEWNAMAAPNGAIWVFSGLLKDMDDDEVAIVLGHELAHATYEHSRKQFKKAMLIQLAALGVVVGAESIDSKWQRTAVQVATLLGVTAWQSGYGRRHEDQADRVGLRYAYEAGFDVSKGPRLWQRFAKKYGEPNKVVHFFLSDHSMAKVRAVNLERELELNYR